MLRMKTTAPYSQPNSHAAGKMIAVVLTLTQIRINIGIPIKIKRKPRNGWRQTNFSILKSHFFSNPFTAFIIPISTACNPVPKVWIAFLSPCFPRVIYVSFCDKDISAEIKKGKGYAELH